MFVSIVKTANASVSSIVIDVETGKVISIYNADERRYPASLTKMMTLYIAFSHIENGKMKMSDYLKISHTAANRSPSRLGLTPGKKIKVEDVIKALIVKSANDCATVMAEAISKDEREFAKLMNQTAKKLGMKNTTFKNASGLPNREQKTTARDMAKLSAALYKDFPQYYKLFSLKSFTYDGKTHKTHNNALKDFRESDGLKTGYTAAAGYNIATSAMRNGKRVIAVTMGHKTLKERDKKIVTMMDSSLTKLAGSTTKNSGNLLLASITPDIKPTLEDENLTQETISIDNIEPKNILLASIIPNVKPILENIDDSIEASPVENIFADIGLSDRNIMLGTIKISEKPNMPEQNSLIADTGTNYENLGKWAIQIGSFSNYAKAKNYANLVKQNSQDISNKDIEIETKQINSAIVYRSKIVGFSKEHANNFCNRLKKSNKSCIVVANKQVQLAYK